MDVPIACICPGTKHAKGDTVTLRDTLGFRASAAIRNTIREVNSEDDLVSVPEVLAALTECYILHGVAAWTLRGKDGKPLPVDRHHIRTVLLANPPVAILVGDAADELYTEAVMLPLLGMGSTSSPDSPTSGSTSATPDSLDIPTPSRPSSTSTTPTDAIETTSLSLVGASN